MRCKLSSEPSSKKCGYPQNPRISAKSTEPRYECLCSPSLHGPLFSRYYPALTNFRFSPKRSLSSVAAGVTHHIPMVFNPSNATAAYTCLFAGVQDGYEDANE